MKLPRSSSLLLVSLLLGTGCSSGFRYGFASMTRPDPDYDALDRRVQRTASAGEATEAILWGEYRGPDGNGRVSGGALALSFGADGPPELWRVPLGPAYSSVVVGRGLVVTMEQQREREAVIALDRETGDLVWQHSWPARHYDSLSKAGPRATPLLVDDRVVALGATGELVCVSVATGEPLWSRTLESDLELDFGLSASPRRLGDAVLVASASGVALHALEDGALRWSTELGEMAYVTPVFAEVDGARTIVVTTADRVVGLAPEDGAERWSFPWEIGGLGAHCTQPMVLSGDRVVTSAGYGKGSQATRITNGEAEVLWRSPRFKTRFNEPILLGDLLVGLDDGSLACVRAEDGKRLWKEGRYGYGQLLEVDGHLLVVGEDGRVVLVRFSPEAPEELASFQALEGGFPLNLPAFADGRLYVRSDLELACFDLSPVDG